MRHPALPSKKAPRLIRKPSKPPRTAVIKLPQLTVGPLSARLPNPAAPPPPPHDPNDPLFNGPVKPSHILVNFRDYLTDQEQSEILQFREVWYLRQSPPQQPKSTGPMPEFFPFVAHDHIAYRYCQESVIGKGSFGSVIQCVDHKTGSRVAIKCLRDRPKVHSQIMFELDLLMRLQNHDGEDDHRIIRYVEHFAFRRFFCIVMELLWCDVYTVLKGQRFLGFSMGTVQMVAKETADALSFMHRCGIVHCDIKPENILFTCKAKKHVKVIDFGCSCFVGKIMFSYIQSRYYRAPEVVLGLEYGREIDIWSLACVVSEMLTGYPLFCADDEAKLINLMVQMRGLPPLSLLKQGSRSHCYFDEAGQLKQKSGAKGKVVPGSVTFMEATKVRDPGFLDFLEKCLRWLPRERLTAEQVLEHPWVQQGIAQTTPVVSRSAR